MARHRRRDANTARGEWFAPWCEVTAERTLEPMRAQGRSSVFAVASSLVLSVAGCSSDDASSAAPPAQGGAAGSTASTTGTGGASGGGAKAGAAGASGKGTSGNAGTGAAGGGGGGAGGAGGKSGTGGTGGGTAGAAQAGSGGQAGSAPSGPGRFVVGALHGALGRFYVRADLTDVPFDVLVDAAAGSWSFGTPDDVEVKGLDPNGSFTSDDYGARYLAGIVAPTKGKYTLTLQATHPSSLFVADAAFVSGQPIDLDPSAPTAVRVEFHKKGGGQGSVHLQWTGPGIPTAVDVPKANLIPDLRALDQTSAAFGGIQGGALPIAVWWPGEGELSSTSKTIPPQFVRADGHTGWKERGVNTVWYNYQLGGGGAVPPMLDVFQKLGLDAWRYPSDALTMNPPVASPKQTDAADKSFTAYSNLDEAFGKEPLASFAGRAQSFEAERKLPMVCTFSGSQLAYFQPPINVDGVSAFMTSCDWIAMDYYPTNEDTNGVVTMPIGIDRMASAIRHIIDFSGGKPAFTFVDTSNQLLSAACRAPTAAEVDAMAWGSMIAGARGIAYFPQVPGKSNDGTTPDVEAELPKLNALLQKWAPVMLDGGTSLARLLLPGGFRGAIRKHAGVTYAIVLNDDDKPATFSAPDGDVFAYYGVSGPAAGTMFAPYQVTITHDGKTETLTFPLP